MDVSFFDAFVIIDPDEISFMPLILFEAEDITSVSSEAFSEFSVILITVALLGFSMSSMLKSCDKLVQSANTYYASITHMGQFNVTSWNH